MTAKSSNKDVRKSTKKQQIRGGGHDKKEEPRRSGRLKTSRGDAYCNRERMKRRSLK